MEDPLRVNFSRHQRQALGVPSPKSLGSFFQRAQGLTLETDTSPQLQVKQKGVGFLIVKFQTHPQFQQLSRFLSHLLERVVFYFCIFYFLLWKFSNTHKSGGNSTINPNIPFTQLEHLSILYGQYYFICNPPHSLTRARLSFYL